MRGSAGRAGHDGHHCHVVYAIPTRKDKYLSEGSVWIDSRDFAVVKFARHPAKIPSFWTKHVEWTRHYKKLGEFWRPVEDDTLTVIRIFGKKGAQN